MQNWHNLKLIKISYNIGAPAALNKAAKAATLDYDYLWKLDNDVVIDQNSLIHLVQTGQEKESIGMIAGTNYYFDEKQTIWGIGGMMDYNFGIARNVGKNQKDTNQYKRSENFDYLPGCALLVKKSVVEKIGLLDEKYFVYYDETDWNIRAKKAGFDLVYPPKAKIWHKASRTTQEGSIFKNYYLTRNKLLFLQKFTNKRSKLVLPIISTYLIDMPFRWVFRSSVKDLPNILKGITWGMIDALSKNPKDRNLT